MMNKLRVIFLCMLLVFGAMQVCSAAASDQKITAEIPGLALNVAIEKMAKQVGMNCLVNGKLNETVQLRFENLTFTEIMDSLATGYDFSWTIKNNVVIASPNSSMKTESKTYVLKYTDLALAKDKLKTFINDSKMAVNVQESSITVDANPMDQEKAEQVLSKMDVPIRQIKLETLLVSLDKSDALKLGPEYEWNSYSNDKSNGPWKFLFTSTLNANQLLSKGDIISRPQVVVYNGVKANVEITDRIPILTTTISDGGSKSTSVTYEKIGTELEVTPRVIEDEHGISIAMDIKPTYSTFTGWVESNGTKAPQISSRTAHTIVRVKNDDVFVISGMIKKEDFKNVTQIPFLGDLPILGKLFQFHNNSKSATEMFIFVKPTVIDDYNYVATKDVKNIVSKEGVLK